MASILDGILGTYLSQRLDARVRRGLPRHRINTLEAEMICFTGTGRRRKLKIIAEIRTSRANPGVTPWTETNAGNTALFRFALVGYLRISFESGTAIPTNLPVHPAKTQISIVISHRTHHENMPI